MLNFCCFSVAACNWRRSVVCYSWFQVPEHSTWGHTCAIATGGSTKMRILKTCSFYQSYLIDLVAPWWPLKFVT